MKNRYIEIVENTRVSLHLWTGKNENTTKKKPKTRRCVWKKRRPARTVQLKNTGAFWVLFERHDGEEEERDSGFCCEILFSVKIRDSTERSDV